MFLYYLTNLFLILFKRVRSNRFQIFTTYLKLIVNSVIHNKIKKRRVNLDGQHQETIIGYKVLFFSYSQLLFLFEEIFISNVYSFQTNSNSPKIIDGGSNIGLSIIYFKMLHPLSEIDAFEPDPVLCGTLRQNIFNNGIHGVKIHCVALGDKESITMLFKETDIPGSLNASIHHSDNPKFTSIPITVVPITKVLTSPKVELIKLDIEGSEIEVINNLFESNTLEKVAQLIIEFHASRKTEATEKIEQLIQSGYTCTKQNSNIRDCDSVLSFIKI